jgi:high-affinity Fe2+/Pb2+ permease
MGRNLFSVPIFFIAFRETFEASIIISVLLSVVDQIILDHHHPLAATTQDSEEKAGDDRNKPDLSDSSAERNTAVDNRMLIRKSRMQVSVRSRETCSSCQSFLFLDLLRGRFGPFPCSCHRSVFHCGLVHQGYQSLGKIRGSLGRYVPSTSCAIACSFVHRHFRAYRLSHDFCHGRWHAQDGPR